MKLYISYQLEGGQDDWVPVHASTPLDEIRPAFTTILACDKLVNKGSAKEVIESAKYLGPMYFDLDNEGDVQAAITDGKLLVNRLKSYGLTDDDFEIFLSGKKGIHVLIPPEVFMEKPAPIARLPAIYKELAFKFATSSTDFAVYSGRSGRMFRTTYRQRDNGNYKVRINSGELDALSHESYDLLCSKPTRSWANKPTYRANFAIVFEGIQQKVAATKKVKPKPVDAATLRKHLPIVQRLMRGENIKEGAGFNKIAIQLALYAHEAKLSADQFVAQASGLVNSHSGDGYRYNTARKREAELRRMYDYLDETTGYEYAIGPLQALLGAEPIPVNGEDLLPFEEVEGDSTSIFEKGFNYFVTTEQGEKHIMDAVLSDAIQLIDAEHGTLACLQVNLKTVGKTHTINFERGDLVSSAALHRAVSAYGVSFTGTDIHARYIFAKMLKEVKDSGKVVYVTQREGLDVIKLPASDVLEARSPFIIWSDRFGVNVPPHLAEKGVDIRFVGYPSPEGVVKTDLIQAQPWPEFQAKEGNKERMRMALAGLLNCQDPASLGKLIGWMTATFYSQLFRENYKKFPLLHINGAAGSGKSEMTECVMHMFYVNGEPPILSPGSSVFAISTAIAGTASVPVIVDEYKPSEMAPIQHNALKSLFRSSYNGHTISKGGGNRTKDSYGALNQVLVSGPVVFIAEAIEQETALLERCIVLTLKRPYGRAGGKMYSNFIKIQDNKDCLSVIGYLIAASLVSQYSTQALKAEFDPIHFEARKRYGLVAADERDSSDSTDAKAGRPRVVYAHAVAEFGMKKFKQAIQYMFQEAVFEDEFAALEAGVYTRMNDTAVNTAAEYVKVLSAMADMTRFKDGENYKLEYGSDYQLETINDKTTLVIIGRRVYNRYMAYCRTLGVAPFFMNDGAFVHGIKDSHIFIMEGTGTQHVKQTSLVLDYDGLLSLGCPAWEAKPKK